MVTCANVSAQYFSIESLPKLTTVFKTVISVSENSAKNLIEE